MKKTLSPLPKQDREQKKDECKPNSIRQTGVSEVWAYKLIGLGMKLLFHKMWSVIAYTYTTFIVFWCIS